MNVDEIMDGKGKARLDKADISMYIPDALNFTSSSSVQMLTPPASDHSSPVGELPLDTSNTFISVSTVFCPGSLNGESTKTDIIIVSSDSVFFYVHARRLLAVSCNRFNNSIPIRLEEPSSKESDVVISIPQQSTVVNILLHTIYGKGCSHFTPSLSDLSRSLDMLELYGMSADVFVLPGLPLYDTFRLHASQDALELYTIAAAHNLHDLAVFTSAFLLSLPLHTLTDDHACRMGALYLKKLFFLHLGRADALRRLLLPAPRPHTPTQDCNTDEQKKVSRAWALACAYLTWDMRVDLAMGSISAALSPLQGQVSCCRCKSSLEERVDTLTSQWSLIKMTI